MGHGPQELFARRMAVMAKSIPSPCLKGSAVFQAGRMLINGIGATWVILSAWNSKSGKNPISRMTAGLLCLLASISIFLALAFASEAATHEDPDGKQVVQ